MKSSGISSAKATPPSAAQPTRRAFALTGRSATIDPRTQAVRPDLADVRLAERVFAPHYAAPMPFVALRDVVIAATRRVDAEVLGKVTAGDPFEVLDLVGDDAWGIATVPGIVGYVLADALTPCPEPEA